jgi:hypothetical protein
MTRPYQGRIRVVRPASRVGPMGPRGICVGQAAVSRQRQFLKVSFNVWVALDRSVAAVSGTNADWAGRDRPLLPSPSGLC